MIGTQPTDPRRVYIAAYVDPEQREFLQRQARANDRSLSAELRRALAFYRAIEQQKRVGAAA